MELSARKVARRFTPEQKFAILKDIESCRTVKEVNKPNKVAFPTNIGPIQLERIVQNSEV